MRNLQRVTLLLFIFISSAFSLHSHSYYSLQNTDVVSQSQSIKAMNKCKNDCLLMGKHFPFKFKYHRYILREKVGRNKYFQGTCHFALKEEQQSWYEWKDLKVFITDTTLDINQSEIQRWQTFQDKCEDTNLKMDNKTLQNMGFQRVHSNFQYYENGTFVNLQPFTDIQDLMGQVSGFIK